MDLCLLQLELAASAAAFGILWKNFSFSSTVTDPTFLALSRVTYIYLYQSAKSKLFSPRGRYSVYLRGSCKCILDGDE